ncbi:MAG: hypothetical protein IJ257_07410 [Treponema sp.]|nr:hypothetical protein [Treponema sp.]
MEEALEKANNKNEIAELEELEPVSAPKKTVMASPRRLPVLLRLTRRTNVFLSLTLIATILLFATGNRQTFLDSNLNLLLKIIASNAIALAFFSTLAILECIFYTIRDKRFKLVFHLSCYILILILSITISVFSLTINLLSEGIDF